MRIDVNAPVQMHVSHSYPHLVGLKCDDNPARHDHKCFIIKKIREKKDNKSKITVKGRRLSYYHKNATNLASCQGNLRAVWKQIDWEQ